MALTTKGPVPKGAVAMSEGEAFAFQMKAIKEHKPESDMWIFRNAPAICMLAGAVPAVLLQQQYRKKLKLMNYGRFSTFLPTVFIPTTIATIVHIAVVQRDIVLLKSHCPVCTYTRSGVLQAAVSIGLPMLLAPFAGFMVAVRHFTYDVPPISEPRKIVQLCRKFIRPLSPQLVVLLCSQFALGAALAHFEIEALFKLYEKPSVPS